MSQDLRQERTATREIVISEEGLPGDGVGDHAGRAGEWGEQATRTGCAPTCARPIIDGQGRAVENPLDRLGIGLSNDRLRRVPDVIGIGGDPEKADGVRATLTGGWLHTLVADRGAARRLLA